MPFAAVGLCKVPEPKPSPQNYAQIKCVADAADASMLVPAPRFGDDLKRIDMDLTRERTLDGGQGKPSVLVCCRCALTTRGRN